MRLAGKAPVRHDLANSVWVGGDATRVVANGSQLKRPERRWEG
jgi:hypothetical protein